MASSTPLFSTACFSLLLLHFLPGSYSTTFTIVNKCSYPVWPGILSNAGTPPLSTTGFALQPGESNSITAPAGWSGRLWGRTLCSQDSSGKFSCVTGDCGSSAVECGGGGAAPPATLAEFTLNGAGGMDFYDVSLVDGYNLPMTVEPQGATGGGNCTSTGCEVDLNGECPPELKVTYSASGGEEGVACKSACDAFGEAEYCCSGTYATPDTCKPTQYSELFKAACPRAYSYAYDDGTSTFTCASADYYGVTFCLGPTTSVMKSSFGIAVEVLKSSFSIVIYGIRGKYVRGVLSRLMCISHKWLFKSYHKQARSQGRRNTQRRRMNQGAAKVGGGCYGWWLERRHLGC